MATKTKKYRGEKKNPYTRNHCIYKAVLKPEHRTAKDEGRKVYYGQHGKPNSPRFHKIGGHSRYDFYWTIIESNLTLGQANKLEEHFTGTINNPKTIWPKGFNRQTGGAGSHERCEDTRAKLSVKLKGRILSKGWVNKMRKSSAKYWAVDSNREKKSRETKKAIKNISLKVRAEWVRKAQKSLEKRTPEAKAETIRKRVETTANKSTKDKERRRIRMSTFMKGNDYALGNVLTEETKAKMSRAKNLPVALEKMSKDGKRDWKRIDRRIIKSRKYAKRNGLSLRKYLVGKIAKCEKRLKSKSTRRTEKNTIIFKRKLKGHKKVLVYCIKNNIN